MANVLNVKLGVCSVTYNGVDLGHTKGGAEVTYEPEHSDITIDQYGNTSINKILIGEKFMAKIPLAEYTIANLKVAMPEGTIAGANARLTIGKKAGAKATDSAAQLILHPIANGASRADDVIIHKAYVASTITLNHKLDEVKVIEAEFHALVDESKSDGNYLGFIGDSLA